MTQELHAYVQEQLAQGVDKKHLREHLLHHGWDRASVDAALGGGTDMPTPPPPKQGEVKTVAPGAHKKILGVVVGVVIVAALGIGGVFAYNKFAAPSPQDVLGKMAAAMGDVHASSFDATVSYSSVGSIIQSIMVATAEVSGESKSLEERFPFFATRNGDQATGLVTAFSLRLQGKSDYADVNKTVTDMTATIDVKTPIKYGPTEIAVRTLPEKTYIKASNLAPIMLFDLSALADQWIELDFQNLSEGFSPVFPVGLDATGELGQSARPADDERPSITKEQQKKLRQILFNPELFIITETLPSEKIQGVSTYHYAYTVDKNKAFAALLDAQNVLKEIYVDESDPDAWLKEDELKNVVAVGEKVIESISGEIWIGKKDYYLYKSTTNMKLSGYGAEVEVSIVAENGDFNQPVTVQAPDSYKTLEQAMEDLFGGFADSMYGTYGDDVSVSSSFYLGEPYDEPVGFDSVDPHSLGAGPLGAEDDLQTVQEYRQEQGYRVDHEFPYPLTDAQKTAVDLYDFATLYEMDSDHDGINDADEIIVFKTNANNADSDGDGFNDFNELENGFDPNGPGKLDAPVDLVERYKNDPQ